MESDVSIKAYNTFGIDVNAKFLSSFCDMDSLLSVLPFVRENHTLIAGGGSNILFTKPFDGLFLRNEIKGITEISRDSASIVLEVGAGEMWHDFVMYCVDHNYGGLENLSLIPGCVGASPMQNIGAYGVEIKDVFEYLDAVEIATGENKRFFLKDCAFGYRESIFKHELKNQFIICTVAFRLQLNPKVNTKYGVIEAELQKMGVENPGIKEVSEAVISIRQSKLPDPKILGNAGSFFKNPVIDRASFERLEIEYPNIPNYPSVDDHVKLAAGWLIEQCGLKGKRIGACGVHSQQALVLVNYGGSTGSEIYDLSSLVLEAVYDKFGVSLEREVNIY